LDDVPCLGRSDMLRSGRAVVVCVVVASVLVLGATAVLGQAEQEALPSLGDVVLKAAATYKGLTSYQDTAERAAGTGEPLAVKIAWAKGPKFCVVSAASEVYYDGTTFTVYMPPLAQYKQQPCAPEMLDQVLQENQWRPVSVAAGIVAAADPVAEYSKVLAEAKVVGQETVRDQECWVVEGKYKEPAPEGVTHPPSTSVKVWHRKTDGAVLLVNYDWGELLRSRYVAQGEAKPRDGRAPAELPIPAIMVSITAGDVQFNPEIAEDVFIFQPPEGAAKVDAFTMPGQAAPAEPSE